MYTSFSAFFRSLISCCSVVTIGFPLPVKLESPIAEYSLLYRRTISEGISKSWLISLEDFPFLWSSTTITLKALSKVLLDLLFINSKLRGLTYCPIKCSRSTKSINHFRISFLSCTMLKNIQLNIFFIYNLSKVPTGNPNIFFKKLYNN
jgi:hypothetical protein